MYFQLNIIRLFSKVQEVLIDVGGIYDILWSPINDDNKQIERKIKIRNVKNIPEEMKKVLLKNNIVSYCCCCLGISL